MRKALSCMLLSATVSACSFAPPYRQPPSPIYSAYSDPTPGGDRLATDLGWREYFGDERLKTYISAALANNRDLASSVARIAQARAQYRIQNTQRLPEVGLDADAVRTRSPSASTGGLDTTYSTYDVTVGVSAFELDFWGRVRNLSAAARARYLGTVEAERTFRLSLISEVSSTYLAIRAGEEQIDLAERTLASRREGLEIAKLRFDAGITSSIDYDQSYTLVTQAATQLADLRRTTAQNANALLVLIGGPIMAPLPAGRSIDDQGQFRPLDAGLPSALLTNRPDILEAEQTLRAANADIGAARAAFFPTISLTGDGGFASSSLGKLFTGAAKTWTFGGLLDLPIFDWGRRRAQVRLNEAERDEAVSSYQKAIQVAFREVSDGLVGRRFYAEQLQQQVDEVAAYTRLAEAARLRYDNGISIYLQVADAERNRFDAEQQLLQLRSAALQNGVSLYIALGGGLTEVGTRPGSTQGGIRGGPASAPLSDAGSDKIPR